MQSLGSKGSHKLITRATRDAAFRKRLLEKPKEAIQEELGLQVPDDFEIRVVEENPSRGYLILPPLLPEGEMNESELDLVAGGRMAADCSCCFGSTSLRDTSAATCGEKC